MRWYIGKTSNGTPMLTHWWGDKGINVAHFVVTEEEYQNLRALDDEGLNDDFEKMCRELWNKAIKEA